MGLVQGTTSTFDDTAALPSGAAHRLLSVHAVARACGVSVRTVYRWLGPDGLPVHLLPGTGTRPILRVAQDDLDAWLSRHRHVPEVDQAAKNRTFRLDGMRFMRLTWPNSEEAKLGTRRLRARKGTSE